MAELPKIASLWIGGDLSWLEQLCLKSFADAGHQITLFSYQPISNLPEGVLAGDANDIYPGAPMLRHAVTGSPAIHADLWRLNLLAKTDQIWVDCDVYCRKPFAFENPFVFGWEKPEKLVCNAVLGLPKDSETLGLLLEFFDDPYAIGPWLNPDQIRELEAARDAGQPKHITEQRWGFTGPAAVTWALQKTGEMRHVRPQNAFFPVSFKDRNHMILSRFRPDDAFDEDTYAVHFWARRMKPRLQEKENNRPRRGSYLHRLLRLHEINPDNALIPEKKSGADAAQSPHPATLVPASCQNDDAHPLQRETTDLQTQPLDYSVFDTRDFLNVILQRSDVLHDVSKPGKLVQAWSEGDETALLKIAEEKNTVLAERALTSIGDESTRIFDALGDFTPRSMADIGCGYGFFSWHVAQRFNPRLILIDLEENDHRHFGFSNEGAAYSSLERAAAFVRSNCSDDVDITTLNPEETDPQDIGMVDMAVSLLACGFHFPVDSYLDFFRNNVTPGGKIILDLRQRKLDSQIETLSSLGEIAIIDDVWKNRSRVMITKAA